jgi:hypothetical protein
MLLFLFLGLLLVFPAQARALGIGQCHMGDPGNYPEINWTYPSGEAAWSRLEPQRGVYNWSSLDHEIDYNKQQGKKIWLQVLMNQPKLDVIPQWAVDSGMHYHARTEEINGQIITYKDEPVPWDPLYKQFLTDLLQAMQYHYEVERYEDYKDTIEAILIASGGAYGEMNLTGDLKDSFWYPEMAAFKVTTVAALQQPAEGKPYDLFHRYFVETVTATVNLYASTFRRFPVVLQTGTGLSGQRQVPQDVIDNALPRWQSHLWLKYNGWGKVETTSQTSDDYSLYNLFYPYRNQTLIGFEVGQPAHWGFDCSYGNLACIWPNAEQAQAHNLLSLNYALDWANMVFACFQKDFFKPDLRDNYPVDFASLATTMTTKLNDKIARGLYPPPSLPAPTPCDLNDDGLINQADLWFVLGHYGESDPANCGNSSSFNGFDSAQIIQSGSF